MSKNWYVFTGIKSESYTISKYRYRPAFPGGCDDGKFVCAIYAAYGGLSPAILSTNLQNYITGVLADGVPQPPLSTKFAYSAQA